MYFIYKNSSIKNFSSGSFDMVSVNLNDFSRHHEKKFAYGGK